MSLPRVSLVALSLSLYGAANAQQALRLNLQQGRTYTYETSMEMDNPMVGKMTQRVTQAVKVTSKKGDRYNVSIKMTDVKVTVPKGSPMEAQTKRTEQMMKGASVTAAYNSRGQALSGATASGAGGMAQSMAGMQVGFMGLEFPAGPVRQGSSWTTKLDFKKVMSTMGGAQGMPAGMKFGGTPMTFKYTVIGFGTQGGKRVANLSYTVGGSMTMSQGAMNIAMKFGGSGKSVVDVATGLQLTNNGTINVNVTSPMTMNQKMVMRTRLK